MITLYFLIISLLYCLCCGTNTPSYGGSGRPGSIDNSFSGHGKITGIKTWGKYGGQYIAIHSLYAEGTAHDIWFGPHPGSGCSGFTLSAGEYINGYRVWYNNNDVYGIGFHTNNNAEHQCVGSGWSTDSGWIMHSGYLSGLFGKTDNWIQRIGFQFTEFPPANSAKFYVQCDNQFWAYVSYDWGNAGSFQQIASGHDWTQCNEFDVSNPTSATIVRVWCQDDGGIGGFIASVSYQGQQYPTTNPVSHGIWDNIGTTPKPANPDYRTRPIAYASWVYHAKGTGPWGGNVSPKIPSQASWIWDGQTNNVIYFQFAFHRIIGNAIPDPSANFIKDDKRNYWYNDINNVPLLVIVIGILVFVNILCICYGKYTKSKPFEYSKVKYENSDSEAI